MAARGAIAVLPPAGDAARRLGIVLAVLLAGAAIGAGATRSPTLAVGAVVGVAFVWVAWAVVDASSASEFDLAMNPKGSLVPGMLVNRVPAAAIPRRTTADAIAVSVAISQLFSPFWIRNMSPKPTSRLRASSTSTLAASRVIRWKQRR